MKKHAENVHQKLIPGSLLITVNDPKQPSLAKKILNKIF